jgi:hypothetical protein
MDSATVRALLAASLDTVADNRRRAELQLKQVSFEFSRTIHSFCVHPPPAIHPIQSVNPTAGERKKKKAVESWKRKKKQDGKKKDGEAWTRLTHHTLSLLHAHCRCVSLC